MRCGLLSLSLLVVTAVDGFTVGNAPAASPAAVEDIVYTIKARKLLYDDELLRPLNLGVTVTNRVAVLWGPVPKVDLGLRAESRLRGMIELRDVRNDLDVQPRLPELLPDRLLDQPAPGLEPRRRVPPAGVPVELRQPKPETTRRPTSGLPLVALR